MPVYLYKCKGCGNTYEASQKMDEKPYTECPSCSQQLHRVPQPIGISFKGAGFHVNDYPKWRR
jgi:putative FmdB family regulatory protein